MLPRRLASDVMENLRELDREPGAFLQMMRGLQVRRSPVPGVAHGHHQPIEVFSYQSTTQHPVAARPFEQLIGDRSEIGH
jgi:hypothetical protein